MKNKAIFLDRDDTIIEDPGYIYNPDQVKLLPGSAAALADFRKIGFKLIIVSNQSAIARGIITEQALAKVHERLKLLLSQEGAYLDRIYYCPFHPEGVIQKFRKESDHRKPSPGMLLTAAKEMNIDLKNSWMIGNDYKDIAAGTAAGCRTILIKSHTNMPVKQLSDPDADFEAINLRETVNIIKREIMPKPNLELKTQNSELGESPGSQSVQPVKTEPVKPEKIIVEPPQPSNMPPEPVEFEKDVSEPAQQIFENEIIETVIQKPPKSIEPSSAPKSQVSNTERLLEDIKLLLQSRHRQEQYHDFSFIKLFAVILQIMVFGCLFIALRYLLFPENQYNSVFTAIGFALVFQIMALTLYIMHNEK